MSTIETSPASKLPSNVLLDGVDTSQERLAFLQSQRPLKKSNPNNLNLSSTTMAVNRTPSNLLELKQRRLIAAADRKKRIITRIISIVGILIILLCAAIVALTLKMAPKIDELVRTKSGAHPVIHTVSRTVASPTISTMEWFNFTTTSDYP